MKFEKFEDILVWQKSKDLSFEIYRLFAKCKDFSFKDQIQRASISIMNNIAEGFERKTNNEFKHFLFIAKRSAGEIRSMFYVAKELRYISDEIYPQLNDQVIVISKMLSGLIKTL